MDVIEIDCAHGSKPQLRKTLRQLPIEEKIRKLVALQRVAIPILRMRGIQVRAWSLPDDPTHKILTPHF